MSPIYSFYDDPAPVASAGELKADNPWHVAGVIFGTVGFHNPRKRNVMASLLEAVEEWQKEFPVKT